MATVSRCCSARWTAVLLTVWLLVLTRSASAEDPGLTISTPVFSSRLPIAATNAPDTAVSIPMIAATTTVTITPATGRPVTVTLNAQNPVSLKQGQLPFLAPTSTFTLTPLPLTLSATKRGADCKQGAFNGAHLIVADEPVEGNQFGVQPCALSGPTSLLILGPTFSAQPAQSPPGTTSGLLNVSISINQLQTSDKLIWLAANVAPITALVQFWPRTVGAALSVFDANSYNLTDNNQVQTLAGDVLTRACLGLPNGWSPSDSVFQPPTATEPSPWEIQIYTVAGAQKYTPLWLPDAADPARRVCPQLSQKDKDDLSLKMVDLLQKTSAGALIELSHLGKSDPATTIFRIAIRQRYTFIDAQIRTAHNEKISRYDVNFSITRDAKALCLQPQNFANMPTEFQLAGNRIELRDAAKRRVMTFAPQAIRFTRRSSPEDAFWCAPIYVNEFDNSDVALGNLVNEGKSQDFIYVADNGVRILSDPLG